MNLPEQLTPKEIARLRRLDREQEVAETRTPTVSDPATAHSPLPWQVVPEGHRLSIWAEGYGFVHTHEVPQAAVGATRTANANSEFIVRAVNSHAALLAACRAVESRFKGTIIGAEHWFSELRSAIVEATRER